MLDFVVFAFTAIIGLLIILLYFLFWPGPSPPVQRPKIPRWNKKPADEKLGDLGELSAHGSLHQYLYHLHDGGRCPVTSFWWDTTHVISVCSPQAFKDTVKLTNRPPKLFKGFMPLIGASSIQYANGTDWEERRKTLFPMLQGEELKGYFPVFVKIAQETVRKWSMLGKEGRIAVIKESFPITIQAICQCCLGSVFESREEVDTLAQHYHKCWGEMEHRIAHGPPGEDENQREIDFQNSLGYIKEIVLRILTARKEGKDSTELPFIDALLQSGVPEEQIVSDTLSFMVGGFHTSGNFLAWLWYYLATHPDVQHRLWEEVEERVGGDTGENLKDYALSTNTYMRQVLDETLRVSVLAPWAARVCDNDLNVESYCVPAHTPIIHALGVALKNETTWEDVDKFDPDRFATNSPHSRRGLEFCPFGVPSRRKCPGYQFSYFEVSVMMAVLMHTFSLSNIEGQCVEKVYGLVTEPKEEFYLNVLAREGV